jgi:hypothetical protein
LLIGIELLLGDRSRFGERPIPIHVFLRLGFLSSRFRQLRLRLLRGGLEGRASISNNACPFST